MTSAEPRRDEPEFRTPWAQLKPDNAPLTTPEQRAHIDQLPKAARDVFDMLDMAYNHLPPPPDTDDVDTHRLHYDLVHDYVQKVVVPAVAEVNTALHQHEEALRVLFGGDFESLILKPARQLERMTTIAMEFSAIYGRPQPLD